jgi:hypothetical protein
MKLQTGRNVRNALNTIGNQVDAGTLQIFNARDRHRAWPPAQYGGKNGVNMKRYLIFIYFMFIAILGYADDGFWDNGLPGFAKYAWQSTVNCNIFGECYKPHTILKRNQWSRGNIIFTKDNGAGVIIDINCKERKLLIVTAAHLFVMPKECALSYRVRIPLGYANGSEERFVISKKVTIIKIKKDKDLAYLIVRYPARYEDVGFKTARLAIVDDKNYYLKKVVSIGFPFISLLKNKYLPIAHGRKYKKSNKMYSIGKFFTRGLSKDNVWVIAHDSFIIQGNSGGPVVVNDGSIIGINIFFQYTRDCKRLSFAVCASEILNGLKEIKEDGLW